MHYTQKEDIQDAIDILEIRKKQLIHEQNPFFATLVVAIIYLKSQL